MNGAVVASEPTLLRQRTQLFRNLGPVAGKPLRFEDEVEIHLLVAQKKSKSLSYLFRFRKLNATPPVEVALGKLIVVCVTHDRHGKMSAAPIPKAIAERIQVAPADLLP